MERNETDQVVRPDASEDIDAIDYGTSFPASATRVTGRRAIAHWIDGVLITVLFFAVLVPAFLTSSSVLAVIGLLAAFFAQLFYFVLTERSDGQSPGKRMMGVRVVDRDGNVPTTKALVIRTVPLYFEWLFLIVIAAIMSSPVRQRLGDRMAGTYVISDESAKPVV